MGIVAVIAEWAFAGYFAVLILGFVVLVLTAGAKRLLVLARTAYRAVFRRPHRRAAQEAEKMRGELQQAQQELRSAQLALAARDAAIQRLEARLLDAVGEAKRLYGDLQQAQRELRSAKLALAARDAAIAKLEANLRDGAGGAKKPGSTRNGRTSKTEEELRTRLKVAEDALLHWQKAFRTQADELKQVRAAQSRTRHPSSDAAHDHRFRRLRALILKELHPDHAPSGSADWAARGELFKAIWPKMEEIEQAS